MCGLRYGFHVSEGICNCRFYMRPGEKRLIDDHVATSKGFKPLLEATTRARTPLNGTAA
ncbi:MAG: hypothetical protein ACI9DC_000241 [Gammaproteobacteria bacterium]|jgi:hypothetical protein